MNFQDRNILITGASKGIGLATAHRLAALGANLFLIARGEEALSEARRQIAGNLPSAKVATYACDVAEYAAVSRAVDSMREQFGEIHGVVNNAGFAIADHFESIEPESFQRLIEVNYLGSVYTTKAALPHMNAGGFVAFTSSVVGFLGAFGYSGYSPAKFALIGFAECLDQELLDRGIQVSVLCPQDTDTPGLETENGSKPFVTKELSKGAKLMSPDEVAQRFIEGLQQGHFLIHVSHESKWIHRLKGLLPGLTRKVMHYQVRKAQKKA